MIFLSENNGTINDFDPWGMPTPVLVYKDKKTTDFILEKEYPVYYFYKWVIPCSTGKVSVQVDVNNSGYTKNLEWFKNRDFVLDYKPGEGPTYENCNLAPYNYQYFQDFIYAKGDMITFKEYEKFIDDDSYLKTWGPDVKTYLNGKELEYKDFIKDDLKFVNFVKAYLKKINHNEYIRTLYGNEQHPEIKDEDGYGRYNDKTGVHEYVGALRTPYIIDDYLVVRMRMDGGARSTYHYTDIKIKYDEVEPYLTDSIKKYFRR